MLIKSSKTTLIYCRNGNGSGIWSSIRLSVRLCTSPDPDNLSIQHIPCMARSLMLWTAPDIWVLTRASVRPTYAVYYVQKSAAYAEITHQRRTSENSLVRPKMVIETSCLQKKTRPHLPDYVIYVPPSYWKLISFVY